MTPVTYLSFAKRYWKLAVVGLLLSVIVILKLSLAGEQRHSAKLQTRLEQVTAGHEQLQANVRVNAELAKAQDAAHAARVERDQIIVSQGVINDYQKQIADLRARAARGVRTAAATANPGGSGSAPVPGIPDPARRTDGGTAKGGLSQSDALIASEIAVRLKALQDWVRNQAAVER